MKLVRTLTDLRRCKRGNTLVVVAATIPLLIAASAIGLDTIQLTLAKRQLQRAADSAALAGVHAVLQDGSSNTAIAAVDRDLTHNNSMTLASPRTAENAPTTGAYAGNTRAVRVALTATRSVPFMSFFTGSDANVTVEATAAAVPDGVYCVVSLESGAVTGVEFGGGSEFNFGCGIATNSTSASAIWYHGSPTVTASPIAARGGVPAESYFEGSTVAIPNSPLQPDPFDYLADPTVPVSCNAKVTINSGGNHTLSPGCYQGLDLKKGNVTLNPGTYIIDGDSLSFGGQVSVTGNGVTFVLTSKNAVSNPSSVASLDMNGGAKINLTAPTSGEYAGLIIYQDPRAPDQSPIINGGANSVLDGAIYMPSQDLTFNGGAGLDVRCLRLVTLRVRFTGSADIVNNCPTSSANRGFKGWTVRLVG